MNPGKVDLILNEERSSYSIGEPFCPQLHISNNTSRPVTLGDGFVFDWEDFAFTDPNSVHLIGPDATELASPYRRDESYFSSASSFTLEPCEDAWMFLPVYAHIRLREPGPYVFWLELGDETGEVYRSNEIDFELVDFQPHVRPGVVELALELTKTTLSIGEPVNAEAVFTNNSSEPLIFLKPQDDSLHGWVNPSYLFTVTNGGGRGLALGPRDGTMAIPVYSEDSRFTVAPGNSWSQELTLPEFPKMQAPGIYRVRLEYMVRNRAIGKAGVALETEMDWESGVFVGRVESDEIEIEIR